jgi:hypothetical protein
MISQMHPDFGVHFFVASQIDFRGAFTGSSLRPLRLKSFVIRYATAKDSDRKGR